MYLILKRVLDFVFSLLMTVILSPFIIVIALCIKFTSKGDIFFKQKRVGKHKKYFYIYKFRTMKADSPKDVPTHLLENPDTYITPVGKFLRKTSLDELPQLFNILKGEMSFIGPRPALWNQDKLIAARDLYKANDILPGLSGWAQVNGRDELPIEIKAGYDGEYVRKISLSFDLKILRRTFSSVVKSEGICEGSTPNLIETNADKEEKAGKIAI